MYSKLIIPLSVLLYTAAEVAALLLPTPTPTVSVPLSIVDSAASPTITRAGWKDWLRSPQDQEIHTSNTCGFSRLIWWSCYDSLAICTNTLLENGHAYQMCSTPGASVQTYDTDVFDHSSWTFNSWPANRAYCPESSPHGITDIYTRNGLTVTGFDCGFYNESATNTYLAASYMLDAASYSAAVKSLSSALAPPTTTPPINTPPRTSGSSTPTLPANDSGGLSTSAKIGIGAGIGGGVLAMLVAVGILCLRPWLERRRAASKAGPGGGGNGSQARPTSWYQPPEKVTSPQLGSPDAPWYQSQYPARQFQQQQQPWQQQQQQQHGYQQQPQYQQQPAYQQTGYHEAPYQPATLPQPMYQLSDSSKPAPAELPGGYT